MIAAADAERRRLERDLHDGAQQRLVALALTLRMAEQRAAKGDEGAAELVRQAGEEAGLALTELRDLARGIHPAILTNRGLGAALDDLAGRATVPVTVVDKPGERLPDAVEAAAYFVVSECLANIGKHAQATAAEVSVRVEGDALRVEVRDDGVGGVELDGGSGLQGLRDRVGALEGTIGVNSPVGVGTNVLARIPLDATVADQLPQPQTGPRVLPDEEAERRQHRRLRLLWVRMGIWGALGALLVLLWALTGAPDSVWFVWPLIGIALVAGLDAWSVWSLAPLRASSLDEDASDRVQAAKAAESGRWLRWLAGCYVDRRAGADRALGGGRRRLLLADLAAARLRDLARGAGAAARLGDRPAGVALTRGRSAAPADGSAGYSPIAATCACTQLASARGSTSNRLCESPAAAQTRACSSSAWSKITGTSWPQGGTPPIA